MKQFGYSQNVVHLLKNRESGKCFDSKGIQYFSFDLRNVNSDYKDKIIAFEFIIVSYLKASNFTSQFV